MDPCLREEDGTKTIAEEIVRKRGGLTLEMALLDGEVNMPLHGSSHEARQA